MEACVRVLVTDHRDTIIQECYSLIAANEVESESEWRAREEVFAKDQGCSRLFCPIRIFN